MYSCNNCNSCGRGNGFFSNYQPFWIIVVIAIVIIWVHYGCGAWGNGCCNSCCCDNDCCCNNSCGNNCGCNNNCGCGNGCC